MRNIFEFNDDWQFTQNGVTKLENDGRAVLEFLGRL